jgi:Holliday junction resolvasome RuvABC endonuclease subunit
VNTKVLGMDISLNHGAAVELTNGKLTNFFYYTTLVGSANKSKRGRRIPPEIFKLKDKQFIGVARLSWIKEYLRNEVLEVSRPEFIGLEDYAIRAEQGAHYLGEAGGQARLLCYEKGSKLRLHDPTSVKMYAAHDGTCQKDAVQRAVERRWGVDFSSVDQPSKKPTEKNPNPKSNRQTSEDLADAYAIAMLVWTEVQLRLGVIALSELPEKEIRVFNRITKTYPINLLDREWINNPNGRYENG